MRLASLLVLALLIASGLAAGQAGRVLVQGAEDRDAKTFAEMPAAARERGMERAEAARLFAPISFSGGLGNGRHVSFDLARATGTLGNLSVPPEPDATPVLLLRSATMTPFERTAGPNVTGSLLRLEGANATLLVHNNPLALVQWRAEAAPLDLVLVPAENASVARDANGTVRIASEGFHGHLAPAGNATFVRVARASVQVHLEPGASLLFLAHVSGAPLATLNAHALAEGAAAGRVGAMASLVETGAGALVDAAYFGATVRARTLERDRAEVTISGPPGPGKAVALTFPRFVFDNASLANLTLRLDDRPVRPAASLAALLASDDAAPAYVANGTAAGLQIVVRVPRFSDHDLVIASKRAEDAPAPTSSPTPGSSPTSSGNGTGGTTAGGRGTPGAALPALLAAVALAAVLSREFSSRCAGRPPRR